MERISCIWLMFYILSMNITWKVIASRRNHSYPWISKHFNHSMHNFQFVFDHKCHTNFCFSFFHAAFVIKRTSLMVIEIYSHFLVANSLFSKSNWNRQKLLEACITVKVNRYLWWNESVFNLFSRPEFSFFCTSCACEIFPFLSFLFLVCT